MYFYHCTRTNNARRFMTKPKKFRLSKFDYISCLNSWINYLMYNPQVDLNGGIVLPRHYSSLNLGDNLQIFWLGSGLYCFEEFYKTQSIEYAKARNLDVILKIDYTDTDKIFDMFSKKNNLIEFLGNELISHYPQISGDIRKKEAFELLIEYLILEIEDEYLTNPHAAAIIIEMYLDIVINDYHIISNKFLKNDTDFSYADYTVIKKMEMLNSFCLDLSLTRELKA